MYVLSQLPLLETLDLRGCSKLTDRGIEMLTVSSAAISTLLLSEMEITDTSLANISLKLTSLTCLQLAQCSRLTSQGVHQLVALPALRELELRSIPKLGDTGFSALGPQLCALSVSNCYDLSRSPPGTMLHTFEAAGVAFTEQAIKQLATQSPALTALDLSNNRHSIGTEALKAIGSLTNLTRLKLTGCCFETVQQPELELWGELRSLRLLCLSHSKGLARTWWNTTVSCVSSRLGSLAVAGLETGFEAQIEWQFNNLVDLDVTANEACNSSL